VNVAVDRFCFISAVCTPDFLRLWDQFGKNEKTCTQAWTWETHRKHNTFYHFLLRKQDEIRAGATDLHTNPIRCVLC